MNKFYLKNKIAIIVSSILATPMVNAQDNPTNQTQAEESVERISVTGSRIKRKDIVSSSPTVTTSAEDFAKAGTATLDDFLLQLPQFQPGQGSFSNSSSGGTVGQSMLNLRGLGEQRNLVMLDGRRLQTSNANGAIDINTLPSNAIGGTEIISGGASATYGSDALSGVVNFNTRTDLDGLEITAKLTQPKGSEGQSTLYGAAYGGDFANSDGSFFVSAEYVDREGISIQEREFFHIQTPSGFTPYSRTLPDAAPSQDAVDALFATYGISGVSNRGLFLGVNNDSSIFAISRGKAINYRGQTDGPYMVTEDTYGYHPGYNNYVQVPLERTAAFAKANYNLGNDLELYGRAQYSKSEAQNIGSEPVLAAPWSVFVPVTNPYIVANSDFSDLLATRRNPAAPIELQVRFGQAGPRTYNTESTVWHALAGIKGYVDEYDLSWDLHVSTGQAVNKDSTTSGSVSYVAMQHLVDQADGGDSICEGGYQPFNGVNQVSAECLDYISRTPENKTTLKQTVIEGFVEGLIAELPAGEARFSVGAHYRKNTYEFEPDEDIAANRLASLSASQHTEGDIDVSEVSAEIYIPLLSTDEIDDALNLTVGYRYSNYNLSGGANTYKAELAWRPVEKVLLRTGYQHALRAPNVEEYFNAGTQQVSNIGSPTNGAGDPCDYRHTAQSGATAQEINDLCVVTGLTPELVGSFRQPSNALVTTTYGESTLSPEEADSITLGAVIESPFEGDYLENMSLTIDYYRIDIEKAIAAIPADQSLAKCYNLDGSNPEYSTANFFCQQFDRNSNGIFQYVNQPYLNLGGYKTSGFDISFNWSVPAKFVSDSAALTLNSNANHLNKFEIAVFEDSPYQDFAGTINDSDSYAKWKIVNSITLSDEAFSITAKWRYISSAEDASIVTNPASETEGTPSYSYVDLSGKYNITDNLSVRAGVNNLTDKEPPVVGGSVGTTNRGTFDSIGRTAFLQATYRM